MSCEALDSYETFMFLDETIFKAFETMFIGETFMRLCASELKTIFFIFRHPPHECFKVKK